MKLKLRLHWLLGALLVLIAAAIGGFAWYQLRTTLPDIDQASGVKNIVPVLVIGSGPAGVSAGMYTSRARIPTYVVSGKSIGGYLPQIDQIENVPGKKRASGKDLAQDLWNQAIHFGARLITDTVVDVDFTQWPFVVKTQQGLELRPLTVIIATGRNAKRLAVPGVEKYWGKGVGDCTICEAPFHKGHEVAVIGGGDTAGDRAMQLAAYAKKVYMIVKNSKLDACGAVQEYIAETKNIEILYNTELQAVYGDEEKVTGMKLFHTASTSTTEVPINGIYFAIGYNPVTDLFINKLALDSKGYIQLQGRTQKTFISGVFAGGDVVDPRYGKTGVATGSGIKAGLDAIDFLQDIGFNQDAIKKLQKNFFVHKKTQEQKLETIATRSALESAILSQTGTVIVDVYSKACPVCKFLLPHVRKLAHQFKDDLSIVKVNKDEFTEIAQMYTITGVPTFLVFKDGMLVQTKDGIKTPAQLERFISGLIE